MFSLAYLIGYMSLFMFDVQRFAVLAEYLVGLRIGFYILGIAVLFADSYFEFVTLAFEVLFNSAQGLRMDENLIGDICNGIVA